MNCEDRKGALVALLYGELPEAEARSLSLHLESCASCREGFAELRQASAAMRQWRRLEEADEAPRPAQVPWQAAAAAGGGPGVRGGGWGSRVRGWWSSPLALPRWGLAGAAACALLLALAAARLDVEWGDGRVQVAWRDAAPAPAPAASVQPAAAPAADLAAQVAGMLRESEDRQLATTRQFVLELATEVNRQRQEDLQLVGYGLGELSQETQYRLAQTNRRLDQVAQYLISQGSSDGRSRASSPQEPEPHEESGVIPPGIGGQGDIQ